METSYRYLNCTIVKNVQEMGTHEYKTSHTVQIGTFPWWKELLLYQNPPPTLKIGNYNNLLTYSTDKHDQIYIHKLQKSVCWLYRQSSLNTAAVFLERASSRGNKQNNFSHRLPFHKSWSMPSSNFWTPYYLRIPK